jgi:outer membrane protein assembly factor BamB
VVEARAPEQEWQVRWSASTDENFYAYVVQRYTEGPYGYQSIDTLYDRATTSVVDDLPPVYGGEATYRVLTSNGVETTRSDAVSTIFGTSRRAKQQREPYYPAIPPRLRPGTGEVYSLTYGSVRAFDLATLERKREASTPELLPGTDLEPVEMYFSPDGERFYIRSRAFGGNFSQVLTPVNAVPLTTGTPEQLPTSFPNRTVASRAATGPNGRVFIGTSENKLLDVDGSTGEVLNELDLPDSHTLTYAQLSPDASTLYAVTLNQQYVQGRSAMLAIDIRNGAFQELDRSFPAGLPHLVGFEPGSQDLYVSVGSAQRTYRKYRARSAEDIGAISVPQGGRLVYTTDQHHYVEVDSEDTDFPSTPIIVQYDADLEQAGPSWRVAAPFRAVSNDDAWLIFSDETSLWSISTAD